MKFPSIPSLLFLTLLTILDRSWGSIRGATYNNKEKNELPILSVSRGTLEAVVSSIGMMAVQTSEKNNDTLTILRQSGDFVLSSDEASSLCRRYCSPAHDGTCSFPLQWKLEQNSIHGDHHKERIGLGQKNGNGLAIYGNRVAVASRHSSHGDVEAGRVVTYEWNEMTSSYSILAAIDGEKAGEWTGFALSMVENVIATGGIRSNGNLGRYQGVARVFRLDASIYPPQWRRLGNEIQGDSRLDHFGHSVSLSSDGSRVVVGAVQHASGDNAPYPGYVRAYQLVELAATNKLVWQPLGQKLWGDTDGDHFGNCVAMAGNNMMAVSAPRAKNQQGLVRVYGFNGAEWIQIGDTLWGEGSNDFFGSSLSISDRTLAVGAPKAAFAGTSRGAVYMYRLDTTMNRWVLIGTIRGSNDHDEFGVSVSVEGRRVAIGASEGGYVQVYEYHVKDNTWQIVGSTLRTASSSSQLGSSVGLYGDRVLASAPLSNSFMQEEAGMIFAWDLL